MITSSDLSPLQRYENYLTWRRKVDLSLRRHRGSPLFASRRVAAGCAPPQTGACPSSLDSCVPRSQLLRPSEPALASFGASFYEPKADSCQHRSFPHSIVLKRFQLQADETKERFFSPFRRKMLFLHFCTRRLSAGHSSNKMHADSLLPEKRMVRVIRKKNRNNECKPG